MCIRDRSLPFPCASSSLFPGYSPIACAALSSNFTGKVKGNLPVSYTHLDVYKRQELTNMP